MQDRLIANPIIILQMLTHTDTMDGMYIIITNNNIIIIMNSSLSYKNNQIHPTATLLLQS